jgi:hypothetical protein
MHNVLIWLRKVQIPAHKRGGWVSTGYRCPSVRIAAPDRFITYSAISIVQMPVPQPRSRILGLAFPVFGRGYACRLPVEDICRHTRKNLWKMSNLSSSSFSGINVSSYSRCLDDGRIPHRQEINTGPSCKFRTIDHFLDNSMERSSSYVGEAPYGTRFSACVSR